MQRHLYNITLLKLPMSKNYHNEWYHNLCIFTHMHFATTPHLLLHLVNYVGRYCTNTLHVSLITCTELPKIMMIMMINNNYNANGVNKSLPKWVTRLPQELLLPMRYRVIMKAVVVGRMSRVSVSIAAYTHYLIHITNSTHVLLTVIPSRWTY